MSNTLIHDEVFIRNNVNRGVEFLDTKLPDWWHEDRERPIDVDKLDISDTKNCILGQMYGSFSAGCTLLGLPFVKHVLELGLDAPWNKVSDTTHEWRRVIIARREASH